MTYLLRDEFTTDEAAPLTTPRTCEPGPGTLLIADTENKISISGGALAVAGGKSIPVYGDPGMWVGAQARAAGLVAVYRFSAASFAGADWLLGWDNGQSNFAITHSFFALSGTLYPYFIGSFLAGVSTGLAGSTNYRIAISLRSSGAFYLIKGGAFAEWTMMWLVANDNTATLYPSITSKSGTYSVDYMRVSQMTGDWSSDYGIADVHATPAVSGTDYTGQANAIIDQVVTAPATLAGEAGAWFRKQDASNGYKMYFNSAGAFKVDRYVSGTPTNVVSVAGVITGSGTRTIRAIADGTALRFYTLSGTTWTQRGSTITDSNFSSQTTITPFADASWTGGGGSIGQLDSWPRTLSGAALAALEAV